MAKSHRRLSDFPDYERANAQLVALQSRSNELQRLCDEYLDRRRSYEQPRTEEQRQIAALLDDPTVDVALHDSGRELEEYSNLKREKHVVDAAIQQQRDILAHVRSDCQQAIRKELEPAYRAIVRETFSAAVAFDQALAKECAYRLRAEDEDAGTLPGAGLPILGRLAERDSLLGHWGRWLVSAGYITAEELARATND